MQDGMCTHEIALPPAVGKDSHGWHVLLGENVSGRLLCVDFLPGEPSEFFRLLGAEVHTLDLSTVVSNSPDESPIDKLSHMLNLDWLVHGEVAGFDGFILHDLASRLLNTLDPSAISRMLLAVHRLLKPGGFCYLGFRNARSLFRQEQRNTIAGGKDMLRPAGVRRLLAGAGFYPAGIRLHAYLLDKGTVLEVLPKRGYISVKNSNMLREKIKGWCYGRFGSRYFAPAYGAVGFKEHAIQSLVERLALQLQMLPEIAGAQLQMMRCQILLGKVIFSFGSDPEECGRLVVVYSNDARSIARREAESAILSRLALRLPVLSEKIPRFIARGSLGVYHYFAISEFPGMTIDRPCPGAAIAKSNAASWLSTLHQSTAERCKASPEIFDEIVANLFRHAVARYPTLQKDIDLVARAVQRRGIERDWMTVWQHGDFKLENLILNPRTLTIVAVIDWELSRERGLPLLDLLYLIVYDRNVSLGLALEDIYLAEILTWKFVQTDKQLLNEYLSTLGLNVDDPTMWAAIYMIHDIGIRRHYSIDNPQQCAILKKMLRETANALERTPFADGALPENTTLVKAGL